MSMASAMRVKAAMSSTIITPLCVADAVHASEPGRHPDHTAGVRPPAGFPLRCDTGDADAPVGLALWALGWSEGVLRAGGGLLGNAVVARSGFHG